jgi:hypothetical protein
MKRRTLTAKARVAALNSSQAAGRISGAVVYAALAPTPKLTR